jgi:hypothetical protein
LGTVGLPLLIGTPIAYQNQHVRMLGVRCRSTLVLTLRSEFTPKGLAPSSAALAFH